LECGFMNYESSRALCRSPKKSIEVNIQKYIDLINFLSRHQCQEAISLVRLETSWV
jgi:hypothetical protein